MMGRYPHLGTFEIEGPGDIAVVDEALAATGTLPLKARSFATLSGGEKQRVVIAAALAQIFRLKPEATRHAQAPTPEATRHAQGLTPEAARHAQGLTPEAARHAPAPTPDAARSDTAARGFRLQAEDRTSGILLLDEPTASLDLGYQLDVVSLLARLHRERRLAVVVSTHDLNLAASLCRELVLIRDGRILAAGPTADVLTKANIRRLYGVDADVIEHPSGHRVVVGLQRVP